jgi:hypothetical protein
MTAEEDLEKMTIWMENLEAKVKPIVTERDSLRKENSALRAKVEKLIVERNKYQDELGSLWALTEFHPRALKLMRKRKNFLVVAEDESYFLYVYNIIRDSEKQKNTWTKEDEAKYRNAIRIV